MAAKCNISKVALEVLNKLQWGFTCKVNSNAILENYLEHLNCSNVNLAVCYPGRDCSNEVVSKVTCGFNIVSISATLNPEGEADIIFDLKVIDYVGGKLPFTYEWSYDSDDFELIGSNTNPQIQLKLRPGKLLEFLVSEVSVEVTDSNGCSDSKSCWFTPDGMACSINYNSCSNPVDLEVTHDYVTCSKPRSLIVSHDNIL